MRPKSNAALTLISAPHIRAVDETIISQIQDRVTACDKIILNEGTAAEFLIHTEDMNATEIAVKDLLRAVPIDVVVQPLAGREKKLLIADMDSTIIQQECLDELAGFAGFKDQVAVITEQAMRGEIEFDAALRKRVAMLKGLTLQALHDTLEQRIKLTPGAVQLVATMNKRGAMTALVSGGFTYFTHRIAQATGFQENQGNVLGIEADLLDGTVQDPILGKKAKADALYRFCDDEGIKPDETLAVGDGANDLMMLDAAGIGVAYHAKPAVAAAAKVQINHADLTALLYLQGIPEAEFAAVEK